MQGYQCAVCKHYRTFQMCEAFPGGIPAAIITGRVDHTKPVEGDRGIQWEPVEGVSPDVLEDEE